MRGAAVLAMIGAIGIAIAGACAAAEAPLPAVNLGVEVRFVQDSGELPRSGRTSVVVGTQGSTPLAASVTMTTSTAAAPQGDEMVQQTRVLNGAVAQLRLLRLVPLRRLQWAWAAPWGAPGAASASVTGLSESTQWVDTTRGFELRPAWPGGPAPVRLEIRAETVGEPPADASGHSAGPRRLAVATTVSVPLGEWFVIGRLGPPAPPPESGLTVSTSARGRETAGRLEVRVLAP
jgi:hypothetical protein